MILRMALRNLGRHRLRSLVSLVAIVFGVLALLITRSTVEGIMNSMLRNTIELSAGHVRITDAEYLKRERLTSLNYPIDGFAGEGVSGMLGDIKQLPYVHLVSPRIKFSAMSAQGDELEGFVVLGVDPQVEMELAHLDRYLAHGRFVKSGETEIVMGYRLLDKLGYEVGDRITIVFTDSLGSVRGYTLDVVGELQSGLPMIDSGLAYIPLDAAQQMLSMPDMVTEILITAKEESQTSSLLSQVESWLKKSDRDERYTAVPWYNHNETVSFIVAARGLYNLMYLLILFLASFVVINTMVMVVRERTKEIGMLAALGLRPSEIKRLFVAEGLVLGLIGSTIGTILGGIITKILSTTGINYEGMEAVGDEFLLAPTLYPEFSIESLVYAFIAGLVVTAIAAYIPARGATRMEPTEALRS